MQVYRSIEQLPAFKNSVITIGTFDGVHQGHQKIISALKNEAARVNGESVIITFHPHPRKIVQPQTHLQLINTLDEKIALLQQSGIDHLVVVPFTHEFANQSAREYVENFLVERFHPHTIIIGYDHQFGHNREGNYLLLEALKDEYGFEVKEISEQVIDNVIISSTKVRQSITQGNIDEANLFLGYPYFFEGTVVEGNRLGRTIGFPTANIEISTPEKLVPGDGVYAVTVSLLSKEDLLYSGMMNIGIRPTIGGTKRVIEVNIFDFDADIYGCVLRVFIHRRLRGEVKFNGLEELKEQLNRDKIQSINALAELQANIS